MKSATPGARNRLRGLTAAAFTLVLLVGLPLALLTVGADPIPDQIPTWGDITRVLAQPASNPIWLIVALIVVAWTAWVVFAVSFAIELIATIRGTTIKTVHSLSPRGAARGLITTMALLVTPVAPMTAFAMQPEVVETRSVAAASPTVQPPHEMQGSPGLKTKSFQRYEVQRGDTLWEIADEKLNDGDRFGEIFRASRSKIQPDGKQLRDPDHIEPGWRLRIPTKPTESGAAGGMPEGESNPEKKSSAGAAVKAPSGLPKAEPTPRKERADAPKERAAPKTEPAPAAESKATASPTAQTSVTETAQPDSTQESGSTGQASTPASAGTAPAPTQAEVGNSDHRDSSQSAAPAVQFQTYDDDRLWGLRAASGVGALLAAGLGASLATRRMLQRRNRRPGQLIPLLPDEDVARERELAEIADPLSMRRVDIALRTLSRDCAATDQPLPVVRQARLSEHQFELFLAEPAQLPAPWCGTNDGTVWTLSAATIPVADEADVDVPAPYPALVTIGHTTIRGHEAHLLLDLDYVAALGVVGDETAVTEIVCALSLELATSVWADDLQVTAIGTLSELDKALKSGRVHHVASPQPTLDQVDKRCTADSDALAAAELDLRSARAAGTLPEVWSPEVLVTAHALSGEQRQLLGACVSRQPRASISTITAHDSLGDWFLELDSDDPGVAILQPLGLRVEPQRVSEDVYQAILATFTRADQSPTSTGGEAEATPEPSLASLPDGPEYRTGAAGVSAPDPIGSRSRASAPVVRVLGSPELAGADGPIEATKRSRCLEIAAYLALHPQQHPENLEAALWPGDPTGEYRNVRSGLLSRTRRWLGTDSEGGYWLQYQDGGSCSLRPEVTTDWAILNQLLPDGPFKASDDDLIAAIQLIRGRPFQGVSSQRYGWAETLVQAMVPLLTDISYELSTRLLTSGRWADAARVAAKGLEIDDLYEPLWRIQIMATSRDAGPEAALDQIQRLEQSLEFYGLDLEQETLDLVEAIRSPISQSSAG